MMLNWEPDPDYADEDAVNLLAIAGDIRIGSILQSRSGRFRWEIAMLPDLARYRDDVHGWVATEAEAKATITAMWEGWLERAGVGKPAGAVAVKSR